MSTFFKKGTRKAAAGRKFAYYKNLSAAQKRIYDQSDSIPSVKLPGPERFFPYIKALQSGLASENRARTQEVAQKLISALAMALGVPAVRIKVLERRPSRTWGEMHGLYELAERGGHALLTVWMRTAKRRQTVAFRTFLRTIIHEFMHHLDYTLLRLKESYHTEGFYKRESSLVKGLLGEAA